MARALTSPNAAISRTLSERHSLPENTEAALSVHDSSWRRELTSDGRVYFFDRSTGASQWHVPNELYSAKGRLNTRGKKRNPYMEEAEDVTRMPGSARAVLMVDCMTESPAVSRGSTASRVFRGSMLNRIDPNAAVEEEEDPGLDMRPKDVLRIFVYGATGLRDTDFMPGKDKSDPYCRVELLGKPDSIRHTEVISDCLDPVWEHEDTILDWEPGDVVIFTICDKDDVMQDINAQQLSDGFAGSMDHGDDTLGKVMITEDDFPSEPSGQLELELEEAGPGIRASLSVQIGIVNAWPQLVQTDQDYARLELSSHFPHLDVFQYEIPLEFNPVVSWDKVHMKQGYTRTFFGAHEETVVNCSLESGDLVEVDGKRYTFDKMSGPRGDGQMVKGRMIRYVYVKEVLQKKIMDGVRWRKVVPEPEPGFQPTRVCLFSDAVTGLVVQVPRIG